MNNIEICKKIIEEKGCGFIEVCEYCPLFYGLCNGHSVVQCAEEYLKDNEVKMNNIEICKKIIKEKGCDGVECTECPIDDEPGCDDETIVQRAKQYLKDNELLGDATVMFDGIPLNAVFGVPSEEIKMKKSKLEFKDCSEVNTEDEYIEVDFNEAAVLRPKGELFTKNEDGSTRHTCLDRFLDIESEYFKRNPHYCQITKRQFVMVRDNDDQYWDIDIFDDYCNGIYKCQQGYWKQCRPVTLLEARAWLPQFNIEEI